MRPGEAQPGTDPHRHRVLILLTTAFTFAFIDRTVLGAIGEGIKRDFELSDTQYGLLQGPAFVVFYVTMCIPVARLAERMNRVTIIAASVALWSLFTALSGMATSFTQLLLCRMGVGLGEAGSGPASQSILSDYFPPAQRPRSAGIFYMGIPAGILFGAVFGGYVTQFFGWRWAFVVLGLPGLLLALAIKLFVREPQRGMADDLVEQVAAAATPSFLAVLRTVFAMGSFRNLLIGTTIASVGTYGLTAFSAPFFLRNFDLNFAEVGLLYGLVTGLSYGLGALLGGQLITIVARRGRVWYARMPAITLALAAPLYALSFQLSSWQAAGVLLFVPGVLHFMYMGPVNGSMQNLVQPRMRATAVAITFVVTSIVSLSLGPPLTGMLIDHLSETALAASGYGDFAETCRGSALAAPVAAACHDALADATRLALASICVLFLWGAGHFLLASRHIVKDLDEADSALRRYRG